MKDNGQQEILYAILPSHFNILGDGVRSMVTSFFACEVLGPLIKTSHFVRKLFPVFFSDKGALFFFFGRLKLRRSTVSTLLLTTSQISH